jgi:hypothetical protein
MTLHILNKRQQSIFYRQWWNRLFLIEQLLYSDFQCCHFWCLCWFQSFKKNVLRKGRIMNADSCTLCYFGISVYLCKMVKTMVNHLSYAYQIIYKKSNIFANCTLGRDIAFYLNNCESLHPKNDLCQVWLNWLSDFGEKVENVKVYRQSRKDNEQ